MKELWTDKHGPSSIQEVAGNRKAAEEATAFAAKFRKGKALMLCGPPGSGKSLIPRLVAREQGFHFVEISASDKRGKDEIESYISVSTSSTLFSKGRVILVDDADGISGRDRGAVQAVARLVKASSSPVFIAANDPWLPKLRGLRACCKMVKLTKVPSPSVEKYLREVCEKEGVETRGGVLKSLARFSDGDMRAALTDLQLAAAGRRSIGDDDLMAIGYRERSSSLINSLPTILRSGSISTSRKLIFDGDKDPDEVLWWIEGNAHREFPPESLERVFTLLSKAYHFRSLVPKQQNWAFKGYMVDMMAGVGLVGSSRGYVPYKPPERFLALARTKQARAMRDELCQRLGKELHCSTGRVRRDHLPYLRVMLEEGRDPGLGEEDAATVMATH